MAGKGRKNKRGGKASEVESAKTEEEVVAVVAAKEVHVDGVELDSEENSQDEDDLLSRITKKVGTKTNALEDLRRTASASVAQKANNPDSSDDKKDLVSIGSQDSGNKGNDDERANKTRASKICAKLRRNPIEPESPPYNATRPPSIAEAATPTSEAAGTEEKTKDIGGWDPSELESLQVEIIDEDAQNQRNEQALLDDEVDPFDEEAQMKAAIAASLKDAQVKPTAAAKRKVVTVAENGAGGLVSVISSVAGALGFGARAVPKKEEPKVPICQISGAEDLALLDDKPLVRTVFTNVGQSSNLWRKPEDFYVEGEDFSARAARLWGGYHARENDLHTAYTTTNICPVDKRSHMGYVKLVLPKRYPTGRRAYAPPPIRAGYSKPTKKQVEELRSQKHVAAELWEEYVADPAAYAAKCQPKRTATNNTVRIGAGAQKESIADGSQVTIRKRPTKETATANKATWYDDDVVKAAANLSDQLKSVRLAHHMQHSGVDPVELVEQSKAEAAGVLHKPVAPAALRYGQGVNLSKKSNAEVMFDLHCAPGRGNKANPQMQSLAGGAKQMDKDQSTAAQIDQFDDTTVIFSDDDTDGGGETVEFFGEQEKGATNNNTDEELDQKTVSKMRGVAGAKTRSAKPFGGGQIGTRAKLPQAQAGRGGGQGGSNAALIDEFMKDNDDDDEVIAPSPSPFMKQSRGKAARGTGFGRGRPPFKF